MKLVNALITYDMWLVVQDDDDPLEIALAIAQSGEEPNEKVKYEITKEINIPPYRRDEKPFVASTISDEEWAPYAGSTIHETYRKLMTKDSK